MSENLKYLQAAKSARRRTDKIGDPACLRHACGVSLSRSQISCDRPPDRKSQLYSGEAGET